MRETPGILLGIELMMVTVAGVKTIPRRTTKEIKGFGEHLIREK